MKTWLLIDLSWLAHRARIVLKNLEYEGVSTGVVYGVLSQILHLAYHQRIRTNRIAIFADSYQSYRRRYFPLYKMRRREERTPEERAAMKVFYDQVGLLVHEVLPFIGFLVFRQTGLESDDLIAQVSMQLDKVGPGDRTAVIVTSDGDLYQCITPRVHWWDPSRNVYLDDREFWVKKGVEPHRWAEVKVLCGCSSDNVPGIPRVGEKTAIKYIQGKLSPWTKAYVAIVSPKGRSIIRRNEKLVVLPHEKTKPVDLVPPQYSEEAFDEVCEKFGLQTFQTPSYRRMWENFFAGNMYPVIPVKRREGHGKR